MESSNINFPSGSFEGNKIWNPALRAVSTFSSPVHYLTNSSGNQFKLSSSGANSSETFYHSRFEVETKSTHTQTYVSDVESRSISTQTDIGDLSHPKGDFLADMGENSVLFEFKFQYYPQ